MQFPSLPPHCQWCFSDCQPDSILIKLTWAACDSADFWTFEQSCQIIPSSGCLEILSFPTCTSVIHTLKCWNLWPNDTQNPPDPGSCFSHLLLSLCSLTLAPCFYGPKCPYFATLCHIWWFCSCLYWNTQILPLTPHPPCLVISYLVTEILAPVSFLTASLLLSCPVYISIIALMKILKMPDLCPPFSLYSVSTLNGCVPFISLVLIPSTGW